MSWMFHVNLLHLFKICENASFLGKGLDSGSQKVQIPNDPHSIVETYSCDDAVKHCILGNSNDFQLHGLSETDLKWSVWDTIKFKHYSN